MRQLVKKFSRGLLTLSFVGILSVVVGFLFFTGFASSNRLFIGFDYKILIAFGFYLTMITLLPVLSVLDARGKMSIKKIYPHLIMFTSLGILGIIYSFLVYGVYLTPFDSVLHSWFDYFLLSAVVLSLGLLLLMFSIRDRERLWNLKLIYLFMILIGAVLEVLSIIEYGQYLPALTDLGISWDAYFLTGTIFLLLGFLPVFLAAGPSVRDLINKTRLLWLVGTLVGLGLVIISLLIKIETLESSLFLDIEWNAFYSFGSLSLFSTTLLLASSRKFSTTLSKLRIIWMLLLLLGVIFVIISFVLALSMSPEISDMISLTDTLLGYSWDFYFMYGVTISFFSLILIISFLYFQTEEISGDFQSADIQAESFLDLKTTPSEMVAYLEILGQNEAKLVNQFKEAVRDDKFRPRVYESLVKHYEGRLKSYKLKINSLKKASPGTPQADKVGALFDSVLGEAPVKTETPKIPTTAPTPPKLPSTPPPSTPPVPPASMPSPSIPPPSPAASMPSAPPPSITPPTPPPGDAILPQDQPADSPLDLIADARSTSIAELRGEMLKELRRLREIFKEE
ncbi:MAG: hypothetical protein ACW97P_12325 [Candidatus Hodarchaeales archaeon]